MFIVEQLLAGQCSAHNGQLFNLGRKQERGGAVIHVFMQPNKTKFRTHRKENKTQFRTQRNPNKKNFKIHQKSNKK